MVLPLCEIQSYLRLAANLDGSFYLEVLNNMRCWKKVSREAERILLIMDKVCACFQFYRFLGCR